MNEFVRFQESNDHEGETWNFWLQVDGNEAELDKLAAALKAWEEWADSGCEYQLFLEEPVTESEVDILIKHSRSGYMRFENKVTGTLKVPEDLPDEDQFDGLYKGGITGLFTTVDRGTDPEPLAQRVSRLGSSGYVKVRDVCVAATGPADDPQSMADARQTPPSPDLVFTPLERISPAPPVPDRTGKLLGVEDLDAGHV